MNGSTGEVIMRKQPLSLPALSGDLGTFMAWVDEIRQLKVMANVDTPGDALTARNNGAQGIGLCRTEHMRQRALDLLLPYQRSDFEGIFRAMDDVKELAYLRIMKEQKVEDADIAAFSLSMPLVKWKRYAWLGLEEHSPCFLSLQQCWGHGVKGELGDMVKVGGFARAVQTTP